MHIHSHRQKGTIMKVFKLNESNLRKGWSSSNQYWFSLKDYRLVDSSSLADLDNSNNISQSGYFVSLGYIPYFAITNEELIRAYMQTISNEKLKQALLKIDDENYAEEFWKYVNVYPELSECFDEFESTYLLNKAEQWCKENGIKYVVELADND